MKKYIEGFNNLDASILLLEILEIKTENRIIKGAAGKGRRNT